MKKKKINIAIVGLGNIGINLYKHLITNKKVFKIKQILSLILNMYQQKIEIKKGKLKYLAVNGSKTILMHQRKKDVDVVIELIGGSDGPAKKLVFNSLKIKKHVVTANKALISKHGNFLSKTC